VKEKFPFVFGVLRFDAVMNKDVLAPAAHGQAGELSGRRSAAEPANSTSTWFA